MRLKKQLPLDKKILSTVELRKMGFTYFIINQLVEEGRLRKLNKSNFENCDFSGEDSDFYYVQAYTPSGVICLLSAAVYYRLSNYRPDAIDIAVPKNKRITTLPDWPYFKLYYFDELRYETGMIKVGDLNNWFKIYDVEKTVVDVIYYRNKVGIEETKEILINYLNREDRDLNKLIRYGELLKCSDILKTYLEVLV
ncbi:MAG: hypothetical protein GT601_12025 [Acidaminobacter sp.]|uniref:type IV toxin-antitoxin system AbiEi family antitoxin domain-containing protein n=1 Tax=Acidaminobacter sp. TaxID=1872102 RepID=UPI0013822986|nr:hypothetical protein [Acidaminobacter sp.]MZQ98394.1 hypothetical protein [Acidaminobacter sp.]